MATGETLQQVLYISDFHGDTALQQNLGINTALSSSIIDQPEFGDKIVKLIVNCGYSVDKYRHFDDYKNFAKAELKGNSFSHDPFIDQRFLGTPINGIYPLSVWDAIHKNVEISIRNQDFNPNLYDLSNVNLREVYGMCVVLLHEYFKQLITIDEGKGNILPKEVRKGFKHSSGLSYTITTYNYSTSRGKYMEDSTKSINIKAKNLGVNDLVNLSWWIDFIQMRREHISNHNELVSKAIDNFEAKGKGVKLSDTMNRILDNITENNYDFFESYKVWYTTKTGR